MYTTQVHYDLKQCDKMPEIYAWFDANGTKAETASLTYDAQVAILTIVNCTGEQPPSNVCNE
jgi:predicted RNase H-like nuclease